MPHFFHKGWSCHSCRICTLYILTQKVRRDENPCKELGLAWSVQGDNMVTLFHIGHALANRLHLPSSSSTYLKSDANGTYDSTTFMTQNRRKHTLIDPSRAIIPGLIVTNAPRSPSRSSCTHPYDTRQCAGYECVLHELWVEPPLYLRPSNPHRHSKQ